MIKEIKDIVIAVDAVLFDYIKHDRVTSESIDNARMFLETLGKKYNLYALWSTLDNGVEEALEQYDLKKYFTKCFICNSFERDYGKRVMSRDYGLNVVHKEIEELFERDYGYVPILLVSDYEGSYKKGCFDETFYYDPHRLICWELDWGYVVKNYDEALKAIEDYAKEYRDKAAQEDAEELQRQLDFYNARINFMKKHFSIDKWNEAVLKNPLPNLEEIVDIESNELITKQIGDFEIEINKSAIINSLYELWFAIRRYGLIDISNGVYEYKLISNFSRIANSAYSYEKGIEGFKKSLPIEYFIQWFPEGEDAYKNLGVIDILSPGDTLNVFIQFAEASLNPSEKLMKEAIDAFPKKKNGTFMKNKRLWSIATLQGVIDESHDNPPVHGKYYLASVYDLSAKAVDDRKLVFEIKFKEKCHQIQDKSTIESQEKTAKEKTVFYVNNGVLEKYLGDDGEVTIPSGITAIGEGAFISREGITSVIIPEGVTEIVGSAFEKCSGLKSVDLPKSTISIGPGAFSNCSGLEKISLADGITSIGARAFKNCSSLSSINLPNSIKEIGKSAFEKCAKLKSIIIPADIEVFENGFSGCEGLTNIIISDGITSIARGAFSNCKNLSSIYIPGSVTSIGDWAFAGCDGLRELVVPDNIIEIGSSAFDNCNLERVTIGSGLNIIPSTLINKKTLKSIVIGENITEISDWLFVNCDKLESVVIPQNVNKIGAHAFSYCKKLKSISLPSGLETIGVAAFKGCISLECFKIPDSVKEIAPDAFEEVNEISFSDSIVAAGAPWGACATNGQSPVVQFSKDLKTLIKYPAAFTEADYTVPEKVNTIADFAFKNAVNLKSVVIPAGVKRIGKNTFYGCSNLEKITILGKDVSLSDNAFGTQIKCLEITWDGYLGIDEDSFSANTGGEYWSACPKRMAFDLIIIDRNIRARLPIIPKSNGYECKPTFFYDDITQYDEMLIAGKDIKGDNQIAGMMWRLAYPEKLKEKAKTSYCQVLKDNIKAASKLIFSNDNPEWLRSLLDNGIINDDNRKTIVNPPKSCECPNCRAFLETIN